MLFGLSNLLPLVFGLCAASATHGAMHRPFFPLLPDGIRHLRRPTFVILTLPALLLIALTTAASFLLLRRQFARHYQTCDLINEFSSSRSFLNNTTANAR